MTKEIKILNKKKLYEGFNRAYDFEFEVPSLNNDKNNKTLIKREVIECSDAVFVLVYAPELDSFVLCQEFRAGVFCHADSDDPFIIDSVAGMIDRDSSPAEIARAEVYEETGLTPGKLQLIAIVYSSPGRMTEKVHVYYTEVSGKPQGGIHGLAGEHEEIATHIIKRQDVYKMMDDFKILDAMTLLALNWFRAKK